VAPSHFASFQTCTPLQYEASLHFLKLSAMKLNTLIRLLVFPLLPYVLTPAMSQAATRIAEAPFLKSEIIFPLEPWHNHASCIVETAGGDLLVCWFHGSGERTADDVKLEDARKRKGAKAWSPRFTMAD